MVTVKQAQEKFLHIPNCSGQACTLVLLTGKFPSHSALRPSGEGKISKLCAKTRTKDIQPIASTLAT